jgi:hypothetical protein
MRDRVAAETLERAPAGRKRVVTSDPAARERYREWVDAAGGWAPALALVAALAFGTYLRFALVARADFPLNDGGLFYLMTEELRRAHYVLPAFTSYNGAGIPFAYPPLGFYLAGLLCDLTGAPLVEVMRLLPALFSTLTIPAFYLLAHALLGSRRQAAVATFAFALLPRTFLWFVMGGGLTRAPGFFFGILMLQQAYLMYTRGRRRFVVSTAVLGALAVLSHAENSWFAAYSAILLFLFHGRDRRGVLHSLAVVAGVLALSAPWWGTVIARHGLTPLAAVVSGGGGYAFFKWLPIKTFQVTDESYLPVFGVLGLLGAFASLAARRFFVPVWLAAIFVLNPRNPATVAMVPLAMLVGVAVDRLLVPGLLGDGPDADASRGATDRQAASLFPRLVLAGMLVYLAAYSAMSSRAALKWTPGLEVLPHPQQDDMHWVAGNTPDTSAFAVLSGLPPWFGLDAATEWFPVLARRPSVATPQGYEWLPGKQFLRRGQLYDTLQACGKSDTGCLERWKAKSGQSFTHVYLVRDGCCASLRASLLASPRYAMVHDDAGGTIFARTQR